MSEQASDSLDRSARPRGRTALLAGIALATGVAGLIATGALLKAEAPPPTPPIEVTGDREQDSAEERKRRKRAAERRKRARERPERAAPEPGFEPTPVAPQPAPPPAAAPAPSPAPPPAPAPAPPPSGGDDDDDDDRWEDD